MQFGTPFLSKNHPKSKYAPALHVDRSHEADRQLGSQGLDPLHEQAVGHGCIQQGAGHTAMQEARISLMSLTNDKGSTHRAIHVW